MATMTISDDRLLTAARWVRLLLALDLALALGAAAPARAQGVTERASVGPGGVQGNGNSGAPALSADGRFVAFESEAGNLVPGDSNAQFDVFVRDRRAGRTERVSVGTDGREADSFSFSPAISADGRFVAFWSEATNLVPGDTNGVADVFVRDRRTGRTERASVGPGGAQADGASNFPAISADGRFVAFESLATNLVPGDTGGKSDVFVRDLRTGRTERVSVGPRGVPGNFFSFSAAISADGRFVAFSSWASNLVPGDTNGARDVFVHDRRTGTTRRVSVGSGGVQANGDSQGPASLSADGRFVAFESEATNLAPGDRNRVADVFVRDRRARVTRRANLGPSAAEAAGGSSPRLSADGHLVAFRSFAANLVPGDTNRADDVFVRNLRTGRTERVSVGTDGRQANAGSFAVALSANGRAVAFDSTASNLVRGDTNGVSDVFVRTR